MVNIEDINVFKLENINELLIGFTVLVYKVNYLITKRCKSVSHNQSEIASKQQQPYKSSDVYSGNYFNIVPLYIKIALTSLKKDNKVLIT